MEYRIAPKFLDDFNVGDKLITPARTITETDFVTFAGLTGDYNLVHTDEEYAKTTMFGTRICYGLLTISIAAGLVFRLGLLDYNSLALLGFEPKWMKPVVIGDTIHVVAEIADKRPTKNPERGILKIKHEIINQRNEVVAEAIQTFLYAARPQ
ncbi:MAG: MaoC family dehydratase N-terminal domain-containing protein [Chloroflexi bacterium]|nr:MaoC family dehydratase N-terminal domain-containing protein [Chloroflexota bacterium]